MLLKERYETERELGHGEHTVTFLARDRRTEQRCVVKRFSFRRAESFKDLDLFRREASLLANLRHPRIPALLDHFEIDTPGDLEIYLVQAYVEGPTLAALVQGGRRFSEREVIGIGIALTRILEYIHGLSPGVIHRDLKPSNVILPPGGTPYLIDFGGAADLALRRGGGAGGSTVVGTYGYMPFEQFEGQARPESDVYALGATLIHLLSGKEPHQLERKEHHLDFRPHVRVSPAFVAVLEKMVAFRWEQRYHSAAELRKDLEALQAGRSPATAHAAPGPRVWLVAGLALVILAGGGSYFWFLRPSATRGAAARGALPPEAATVALSGTLLYDRQPVSRVSAVPPEFQCLDIGRGMPTSCYGRYRDGEFFIDKFPVGDIRMDVGVNANTANPPMFPGDLQGFARVNTASALNPTLAVDMLRVIHLTAPFDNDGRLEEPRGNVVTCTRLPHHPNPVTFRWEPIGTGIEYAYKLERAACKDHHFPWTMPGELLNRGEPVVSDTTRQTEVQLAIPASDPDHYYWFSLSAWREGRRVAALLVHSREFQSAYPFSVTP